jgi:hypothetical protein
MTVADLIEYLKKQPQDIKVAHEMFSEQFLIDENKISVKMLCKPRPDGWIQDLRPDMESEMYLVLPGN